MQNRIKELMEKVGGFKPATLAEIEDFRIKILGKKGELTALFEEFKSLSAEQKKEIGKTINELKTKALDKINELKESLDTVVASDCDAIDMSRPATARRVGTRHPISLVRRQIVDIFSRLGFTVADGPEIEDDWHVF